MTMGPAPIIMMVEISVRLGIRRSLFWRQANSARYTLCVPARKAWAGKKRDRRRALEPQRISNAGLGEVEVAGRYWDNEKSAGQAFVRKHSLADLNA